MFKVGDKVRLNKDNLYLLGKWPELEGVLTVESLFNNGNNVSVSGRNSPEDRWIASRFELVEEKPVGVDFTKPVTTRDGRKVRILCTDRKSLRSVIVLIENEKEENCWSYLADGRYSSKDCETPHDLINPPVKKYINLFKNDVGKMYYSTREEAEKAGNSSNKANPSVGYIKTVEVEF